MEIKDKEHHSFKHAFDGLKWSIKTQSNYRVHLIISFIVIILGFVLKISYFEWLLLCVLITFGLVIEAINTALEAATDAITKEWNQDIKTAKDVSAAAMLTFACGASLIGFIIFIPKIIVFLGL